ncbi:MAG: type VI secretion system baseplate subunit TssK [Bacteroidales bacterium]|nr:type VI secretion system baseplate subunit TssK [Bacteroidales bacterium]
MAEAQRFEYWPVNWMDGMSIHKDHFVTQDMYTAERMKDLAKLQINDSNFGLIPQKLAGDNFKINVDVDNQNMLKVTIDDCQAFTSGGFRININSKVWKLEPFSVKVADYTSLESDDQRKIFYVVLGVDLFHPVAWGEADQEEDPPRHPFNRPDFALGLIQEKEIESDGLSDFMFPLSRISVFNGEIEVDKDYLPPCMTMESHNSLTDFLSTVLMNLRSMEGSSVTIVQKVRGKHQDNPLALAISDMAKTILNESSYVISHFNQSAIHSSPIQVFEYLSAFARNLKNTIETWQGIGKEEMLTYMVEWCDLNQGVFEKHLNELIDLNYKHYSIDDSIHDIDKFFAMMTSLFSILADLDYIGKKIDTNMFVKEEVMEETIKEDSSKSKKGFFKR